MEILKYPNPILTTPCESVRVVDAEIIEQLAEMLELMYAAGGVGLAAPQVGISKRMLVMNPTGTRSRPSEEHMLINPVITNRTGKLVARPEGCLSLPGIAVSVSRPKRVAFKAWTPFGQEIAKTFTGFTARVLLHEVDHLDGKLIAYP